MTIAELIAPLEAFAPLSLQEDYDNAGLIVGSPQEEITRVLTTLDVTMEVVEEATKERCTLIIAHHPILFRGIKKLNGLHYTEQIVMECIRRGIALYACHTNLDAVRNGVNAVIADKLGLQNRRILRPKKAGLSKLYTYVPEANSRNVLQALFDAGAGHIGEYSECSFSTSGQGSFRASQHASPTIGQAGGAREEVKEVKLEVLLRDHLHGAILAALRAAHPYEEVAYEIIALQNTDQETGSGMIGELAQSITEEEFLSLVRDRMQAKLVRHTALRGKPVQKVAICGGSGSFLLRDAMSQKADAYVTADFKYHEFFDAQGKIVIADIGHYESEQYTGALIRRILLEKFPNFAVLLSPVNTNPVNYYC